MTLRHAPTFPFLAANKRLLQTALGDWLAPGVEDYLDLFRDDAVLEIPYGATEAGDRVEGKAAISAYMEQLRGKVTLEEMRLTASYVSPGGEGGGAAGDTMVLEYAGTVHAEKREVRFRQRYIAVVTVRDGRIALFREYTNPLLARNAFAGGDKA